ncbi:MAG: spore coat protein CotJB [Eubacteriales bacterium]|nr:spore coat protein CotJB [Eubacteriales bacterium]
MITKFSFMLDDIVLYLDTHPDCKEAIEAYNHYKMLRQEAICEYTKMYGPICKYNVDTDNCWDWINRPWPWEGACDC